MYADFPKAVLLFLLAFALPRQPGTNASRIDAVPPQDAPGAMAHHHSCIDEERAAIERGEGFGMAGPADRNGYPGPKHALELRMELKLSPEQVAALEKLQAGMTGKAVARGKEIFSAEARLEEMFHDGRPEAELREQSFRIDSLHAELRWVHLSAHLAARALLTPEQLSAYQRLRSAEPVH